MAHVNTDFEALSQCLYQALVVHRCTPLLEVEETDTSVNDVRIRTTPQYEKRFFPIGTAEEVFQPDKLEQLFELVVNSEQPYSPTIDIAALIATIKERKLLTFLATLVYSRCRLQALRSFMRELVLAKTWSGADETWSRLPIKKDERLRRTLGDDVTVDAFLNSQDLFCAVVLKKGEELKFDFRRVPYTRERLIGQGTFGKVYEVSITPGHFKEGREMSNRKEKVIARKDFELSTYENAHEKERDVLREILRNTTTNSNIMESLGSLEIGSTYSLFMELADCDLYQYMMRHPQPPMGWTQKAKFLQCAIGLSEAIVHLHTKLVSDQYEQLSCFHMDLKPQNILVVTAGEQTLWKLSDFNMSRVKTRRRATTDYPRPRHSHTFGGDIDFNKLFNRRAPGFNDSSLTEPTINRRGTGTYLAPEACVEGESVTAASDIWSLGCVIGVVLTYLQGGASAVEEFTRLRAKQGFDQFFSFSTAKEPRKIQDAALSEAVLRWFSELRRRTMENDRREGLIFEHLIRFLKSNVLVVDPKKRRATQAADIRDKLIEAYKEYDHISTGTSPELPTSRFDRLTRHLHISRRSRPDIELSPQDWSFNLSGPVKACEFGPRAQILACLTETEVTAYSMRHICLTGEFSDENMINLGKMTPMVEGRTWMSSIGVSQQYIVAATDHSEFDCYIYHIPNHGSHTGALELFAHVELALPSVFKIAMSPDGSLLAFVLRHPTPEGKECNGSLYVVHLSRFKSTHSTRSSSTGSSLQSSASADSILGHPIPLPAPAEDIRELKFSSVNVLYAVMKPQHTGTGENAMTILSWSFRGSRGQALPQCKIVHDGQDDLLHGLFTSFVPFDSRPACLVVSQERRIMNKSWDPARFHQCKARGYRLTKVLLGHDDQKAILFGIREANNELRLLTSPVPTDGRDLKIAEVTTLPKMTLQSKFAASVYSSADNARLKPDVWIADVEGHSIRLIPVGHGTLRS